MPILRDANYSERQKKERRAQQRARMSRTRLDLADKNTQKSIGEVIAVAELNSRISIH